MTLASIYRYLLCVMLVGASVGVRAQIVVTDDAGQPIKLPAPAKRIISLAPHITELLFAAGAGPRVVGVMEGSDYPVEALKLPRVGGASALNIEAILKLEPDLVIVWQSGNPPAQLARLRAMGVPLFISEPRRLEMIPQTLKRFGVLAGTQAHAQAAASQFEQRLQALPQARRDAPPVRVFYQIWRAPLMTINQHHIISDVMRACQAENVFADQPALTPIVSAEAVVAQNPEVFISSASPEGDWRAPWLRFRHLVATARHNFCEVDPDWMSRSGPRLIDGAESLCQCLNQARQKRPVSAPPAPRR